MQGFVNSLYKHYEHFKFALEGQQKVRALDWMCDSNKIIKIDFGYVNGYYRILV